MNDLQVFGFEGRNVRVVEKDGNPWWVLADVCEILDLTNPSMVAGRIDENKRSKLDLGRQGEAIIINEPGLYSVIFRSDKPEAERFRDWVFTEVIPSIRKTGSYGVSPEVIKSMQIKIQDLERAVLPCPSITKRAADPLDSLLLHADIGGWITKLVSTPAILEHKGIKLEYSRAGIPVLAIEERNSWISSISGARYRYAFRNDTAFMESRRIRVSGRLTDCLVFSWHELEDRYE